MAKVEIMVDTVRSESLMKIDGRKIRGIAGVEISRATLVHFIDGTTLQINHQDQRHFHRMTMDDEHANLIFEKSRYLMLEHEDD